MTKVLLESKVLYLLVIALSSVFAITGINSLFWGNKTPLTISCEGVLLDESVTYHLTNINDLSQLDQVSSPSDIKISYPNEENLPKYLGTLQYISGCWELILSDSIQDPTIDDAIPFLPFARLSERGPKGFVFYEGGTSLSEELYKGISINQIGYSKKNRFSFRIHNSDLGQYLSFTSEGAGISYSLPDTSSILHIVNGSYSESSLTGSFVFYFENLKESDQFFKSIEITPYSINSGVINFGNGQQVIFKDNHFFEINKVLLKVSSSLEYGKWTIVLFVIYFLLLIGFSVNLIIKGRIYYNNPIQSSIIKARVLINCLAICGIPLYIKTISHSSNGLLYDIGVLLSPIILNLSFFIVHSLRTIPRTIVKFLQSLEPFVNKPSVSRVAIITFLVIIPSAYHFLNIVQNERFLNVIPALHAQKIIIIFAYFFFSSKYLCSIVGIGYNGIKLHKLSRKLYLPVPKPRNFLILIFSGIISLVTHDFGSILFVTIAILLIELEIGSIKTIQVFTWFTVFITFIFFVHYTGWFETRKLYRVLYSYFAPDNEFFSSFNRSDRESISYIYLNLKTFIENPSLGLWADLKIPDVSQSVSHSDYAFAWSMMLGGWPFLGIVSLLSFVLCLHLLWLFKATINRVSTSTGKVMSFATYNLSVIVSFWLAITIVQLVYQIFTNNLLFGSILSGIPMPGISVGRGDYLFLLILFIMLELIFYRYSFLQNSSSPAIASGNIFRSALKMTTAAFLLVSLLFGIKYLFYKYEDNSDIYIENSASKNVEQGSIYLDTMSSEQIVKLVNDSMNHQSLIDLDKRQAEFIRSTTHAYYNGQSKKVKKQYPFRLTQSTLNKRQSWDSHFKFNKDAIEHQSDDFGTVYSKKILVNDKLIRVVDNPHFIGLPKEENFMTGLSAEINKELLNHMKNKLSGYEAKAAFIVIDNATKKIVANAQYPNTRKDNIYRLEYLVGSVKKPILLDAAISLELENFHTSARRQNNLINWIKYSSNPMAGSLLESLLKNKKQEFQNFLYQEYDMNFYALSGKTYSDRPADNLNKKQIQTLSIGGQHKHTIIEIGQWYSTLSSYLGKDDKNSKTIVKALNAPLDATAISVGQSLIQLDLNKKDFIAKTGTLEHRGNNLSSTFAIADKESTVVLCIFSDDQLPANDSGALAKSLFNEKILNKLIKYRVF